MEEITAGVFKTSTGSAATACIKHPSTGASLQLLAAALHVWGRPLPEETVRELELSFGHLLAAVCELPSYLENLCTPYISIVAHLLKKAGYGRLLAGFEQELTESTSLRAWWRAVDETRPMRVMAASVVQKHWRGWRRLARLKAVRRQAAARCIQRGCYNWILKPVTDDGQYGINVRILKQMECECLSSARPTQQQLQQIALV